MAFRPVVHSHLTIGGQKYHFLEHPVAKGLPYGQTGRRATVYQVRDKNDRLFALKVFTSAFRSNAIEDNALKLENLAHLPGMGVCARKVLTRKNEQTLIWKYPDLEYAVLMPWAEGRTWQEMLLSKNALSAEDSRLFARKLSSTLSTLEENNIAHCDLSGPNVLISDGLTSSGDQVAVSLVDVEDVYGEGFLRPPAVPAGSVGYGHMTSKKGVWSSVADRFAGAILLAEMLTWCDDRVIKVAYGEQFFFADEVQTDCKRFQILHEVIDELYGGTLAELLQRAWYSKTLDDCPTLYDWQSSLVAQLQVAQPRASTVQDNSNGYTALHSFGSAPDGQDSADFAGSKGSSPHSPQVETQTHQFGSRTPAVLPWSIAVIAIIISVVLGMRLSSTNDDLAGFRQAYYDLSETVDVQATQIADQAAQIANQEIRLSDQDTTISDLESSIEGRLVELALLEGMIPVYIGRRELVYGPKSDQLKHFEDDYIEVYGTDSLRRKNFIARAVFQNPFDADEHSWDYGFLFRDTGGNQQYRLAIFSTQYWELTLHTGESDGKLIGSGDLTTLNTDANAPNDVVVFARDGDGFLFVNGSLVSWFDLSDKAQSGNIYVATGMYNDDEVNGAATEFSDFTVWSLP